MARCASEGNITITHLLLRRCLLVKEFVLGLGSHYLLLNNKTNSNSNRTSNSNSNSNDSSNNKAIIIMIITS